MSRPRTKPIDLSGNEYMRTSIYIEKRLVQALDKLCQDTRESRSFYISREVENLLKRTGYHPGEKEDDRE